MNGNTLPGLPCRVSGFHHGSIPHPRQESASAECELPERRSKRRQRALPLHESHSPHSCNSFMVAMHPPSTAPPSTRANNSSRCSSLSYRSHSQCRRPPRQNPSPTTNGMPRRLRWRHCGPLGGAAALRPQAPPLSPLGWWYLLAHDQEYVPPPPPPPHMGGVAEGGSPREAPCVAESLSRT